MREAVSLAPAKDGATNRQEIQSSSNILQCHLMNVGLRQVRPGVKLDLHSNQRADNASLTLTTQVVCQLPMRRLSSFIAVAAWLLLAGCGSTSVHKDRQAETKASADEHIVVLLSRYSREGVDVTELGSIEGSLEACIRSAAQRVNESQAFLYPTDFRALVSTDAIGADGSMSVDSLLRALGDRNTAARLARAQARFAVLLDATYTTSQSKWGFGASDAGFAVGKDWTQNSSMKATILDLKHARIAGSITAFSTGPEGGGVGVFIIIPFPIYFTSMAESRACGALGKELARFISGTSTP